MYFGTLKKLHPFMIASTKAMFLLLLLLFGKKKKKKFMEPTWGPIYKSCISLWSKPTKKCFLLDFIHCISLNRTTFIVFFKGRVQKKDGIFCSGGFLYLATKMDGSLGYIVVSGEEKRGKKWNVAVENFFRLRLMVARPAWVPWHWVHN